MEAALELAVEFVELEDKYDIGQILGRAVVDRLGAHPDLNLALRLADKIPQSTVVLSKTAATLASQVVTALRGFTQLDDANLPSLAGWLDNLGVCLSALGQPEQALACAKEAVDLYRTLAEANPDAHRPRLAGALTNLSLCLRALGQPEQALACAKEAVDLYGVFGPNRRKYALAIGGGVEPGNLLGGHLLSQPGEVDGREVGVELVAPVEVDVLPGHG